MVLFSFFAERYLFYRSVLNVTQNVNAIPGVGSETMEDSTLAHLQYRVRCLEECN